MATAQIKAKIKCNIHTVWKIVLDVEQYGKWRSDIREAKRLHEHQFVEITDGGYSTTFTVTAEEAETRWEFDMENSNMRGHWTGVFTANGSETEIDFTENVTAKKFFMKPLVKSFLKKQQAQFVRDLQTVLNCSVQFKTV